MNDAFVNYSRQPSKSEALVEALLKASIMSADRKIVPRKGGDPPPLSFAQQRLWFLDQMMPGNPAYNVIRAYRMAGAPDPTTLRRSLSEIIRRHDTLRTTFRSTDTGPVQIIEPYSRPESFSNNTLPLLVFDFRNYPQPKQREEIERLIQKELRRPFDLTKDLLLRAFLIHQSRQEHIMLVVIHHIISDGWSISILLDELSQLYTAYIKGKSSALEELPIQYADYSEWHRDLLESEALKPSLDYWRKHLHKHPNSLNLPTDHVRPRIQTFEGARYFASISKSLTDGLRDLSQKQGVTLFMLLQAAFFTLLYRYTGQEDIIVGTPLANRRIRDISKLIGFFVSTIPLRVDLSGNPTFLELLERVRKIVMEAFANQEISFEKIVEELQPQRNLSHSPIFQVLLVLQNMQEPARELADLTLKPMDLDNGTAKYDLALIVVEQETDLHVTVEYSTDLFDESTIRRLTGHFQILLQGIVDDADQPIAKLPLLTESERQQILVEWNNTQTDYPRDQCVHQLFEAQVEKTPDAIAVVFKDQSLTYRELNERSNQLAHYLRENGVCSEILVGICVERSLEMIIGLLAILKAGGAYVPLDPSNPKERLGFMLEDANALILLTQSTLLKDLPDSNAKVICLDSDWPVIAQMQSSNPNNLTNADNLSYAIYTSGSTGLPKGVMIPHRGIVRLLFGIDYVHLSSSRTFLHVSSLSFDLSTFEIWGALLHGANCILFPERIPTASQLESIIQKHGVDTLWLTSSLFNAIIDEKPQALKNLRQLLIGGEELSPDHVFRAMKCLPDTEIINGYGPTEATTFTSCYSIPKNLDPDSKSIPIGRPISNTSVYVLDPCMQPLPIGIPGELYIGGDGLAKGYLNRPELTAEKFVSNPFSSNPEDRIYKSGDLVKWLPDGNLDFLSRTDNQVKIRGYRIELGEIESVLNQFAQAKKAVVTVRENFPGDKRLIAYIVSNQDNPPDTAKIRAFLKEKLPDYMIPSLFISMEEFPLTQSGKVDRLALPKPDSNDIESDASIYIAPRTPVEKLLVEIWIKILNLKKVGINDNFFDLGGHSLLATKLVAWVQRDLDVPISVVDIFDKPTIAELALAIVNIRLGSDN